MRNDDVTFKALVVNRTANNTFTREIRERSLDDLPPGELVVRVHYSSLNYKDALSATGHPGITRRFPHTPGIDAAGEVIDCRDGSFAPGEKVIVTGHDLGMNTPGGWGQYIRVPAKWAVPLPDGLTFRESMALGTAGLTAALSVLKLQKAGLKPLDGDVIATGATGGVGSIAVSILAAEGYRVVAATGKMAHAAYLEGLGAASVISRDQLTASVERALLPERWAGALDVAGGLTLAAVLKGMKYGGVVACCGMAGSPELSINVYPFILRGVSLIGVDSAQCPYEQRMEAWQRLANAWKPQRLAEAVVNCTLNGLEEKIHTMLAGRMVGRVVVDLTGS
jgi:putative YhdH/YhfP family quinone oxidoreductase